MKRFVTELLVIVLLTATLIACANIIYVKCDKSENEMDVFDNMPSTIQVCNVGSSHGKVSFDYEKYSDELNCFNFGLTSQRYQYDYRLLYNYSDIIEEGAVVFIPFSYFSVWGTPDEEEGNFLSMNKRYYQVLPSQLIIDYDPWTDICEHYIPVLSAYDGLIDAIKDTLVGDGDNVGFGNSEIDFNVSLEESYEAQVLSYRNEDGTRIINNERIEALYELIDLCKAKGVTPILITTPIARLFSDTIKERDPEYLDDFYKMAEKIAKDKQIEYYDYSEDSRICDDLENFYDVHHLNEDGAKLFTDIVMEEIVSNYYKIK